MRCQHPASENPVLAGIKHLNRLDQVLASMELSANYLEGLMLTSGGKVVEGTRSNVFLVRDGRMLTPLLASSGVAGIMRDIILECCEAHGIDVDIRDFDIEELQKAETYRREFVANVSHELKTPLFSAQGFIHTLIDGADQDEKVRKNFLKKAAQSLDHLEELVQDILKLSQIETGEIKMKLEPTDMYALSLEVVEKFRTLAEKKKINLSLREPKGPVMAQADRKWIGQVISNLVSNAINYSPEGGEVEVRLRTSRKFVTTHISDTGEGIPEKHLSRIFERFYRVDKSRSKELGGTGLGLAIVKHILEGHGTRAEVKSEVGKGSVFSFGLHRTKQEP